MFLDHKGNIQTSSFEVEAANIIEEFHKVVSGPMSLLTRKWVKSRGCKNLSEVAFLFCDQLSAQLVPRYPSTRHLAVRRSSIRHLSTSKWHSSTLTFIHREIHPPWHLSTEKFIHLDIHPPWHSSTLTFIHLGIHPPWHSNTLNFFKLFFEFFIYIFNFRTLFWWPSPSPSLAHY